MRCPSCGGLNPRDARWCGQCLERFPEHAAAPARAVEVPSLPRPVERESRGGASSDVGGPFMVTGTEVAWRCPNCETQNPVGAPMCAVCATPFADVMEAGNPERPTRDPGTAALISLFFPGAGHAYVGLWGQAVARGVISTWVVAVALVSAVQGGSTAIAVVFGLASFALWVVSAHDAYREAANEGGLTILKSRQFLYVVLGLLTMLMALVFTAALRTTAG